MRYSTIALFVVLSCHTCEQAQAQQGYGQYPVQGPVATDQFGRVIIVAPGYGGGACPPSAVPALAPAAAPGISAAELMAAGGGVTPFQQGEWRAQAQAGITDIKEMLRGQNEREQFRARLQTLEEWMDKRRLESEARMGYEGRLFAALAELRNREAGCGCPPPVAAPVAAPAPIVVQAPPRRGIFGLRLRVGGAVDGWRGGATVGGGYGGGYGGYGGYGY